MWRARWAIVVMALVGFAVSVGATFCRPWPTPPSVHDEFSYLLAADTFRHGRLTNPPPPVPEAFESFHILVEPSYASKYPPGQGLLLALGDLLGGHPIVGVWLSAGLLTGALTWMLLGWMNIRWAAFGSSLMLLLLVGQGNPFGNPYWLVTYWGGTLPALGGALVFGSIRRLTQGEVVWGVTLGSGFAILMLTRAFEGLLLSIPPLLSMSRYLIGTAPVSRLRLAKATVAPCAAVLIAALSFWGVYNHRVTGSATTLPYALYEARYSTVPLFLVGPSRTQDFLSLSSDVMRRVDRAGAKSDRADTPSELAALSLKRLSYILDYFSPTVVALFLLAGTWVALKRGDLSAVSAVLLVVTGSLLISWYQPHYLAPMVGPWTLLLTLGARRLWTVWPSRPPVGHTLVGLVYAFCLLTAASALYVLARRAPIVAERWQSRRSLIDRTLPMSGGEHLVIVSYGALHDPDNEWVYNGADLPGDSALFARWSSPSTNARLAAAYPGRTLWRLHVDDDRGPFVLTPFLPAVIVTPPTS